MSMRSEATYEDTDSVKLEGYQRRMLSHVKSSPSIVSLLGET